VEKAISIGHKHSSMDSSATNKAISIMHKCSSIDNPAFITDDVISSSSQQYHEGISCPLLLEKGLRYRVSTASSLSPAAAAEIGSNGGLAGHQLSNGSVGVSHRQTPLGSKDHSGEWHTMSEVTARQWQQQCCRLGTAVRPQLQKYMQDVVSCFFADSVCAQPTYRSYDHFDNSVAYPLHACHAFRHFDQIKSAPRLLLCMQALCTAASAAPLMLAMQLIPRAIQPHGASSQLYGGQQLQQQQHQRHRQQQRHQAYAARAAAAAAAASGVTAAAAAAAATAESRLQAGASE
jgi:hypothetical protein